MSGSLGHSEKKASQQFLHYTRSCTIHGKTLDTVDLAKYLELALTQSWSSMTMLVLIPKRLVLSVLFSVVTSRRLIARSELQPTSATWDQQMSTHLPAHTEKYKQTGTGSEVISTIGYRKLWLHQQCQIDASWPSLAKPGITTQAQPPNSDVQNLPAVYGCWLLILIYLVTICYMRSQLALVHWWSKLVLPSLDLWLELSTFRSFISPDCGMLQILFKWSTISVDSVPQCTNHPLDGAL